MRPNVDDKERKRILNMILKLTTEDNPEPSIGQLARALDKDKTTTGQILKRMAADGLVTIPKQVMTGRLAVLAKGRKMVER